MYNGRGRPGGMRGGPPYRGRGRGSYHNSHPMKTPLLQTPGSEQSKWMRSQEEDHGDDGYGIRISNVESYADYRPNQDRRGYGGMREDSSDSAIEFSVPDDELAEFDTEEKEPRLNKFASEMRESDRMNRHQDTSQPQASPQNKPKKKRKFGLEYIVVTIPQAIGNGPTPSMKTAPHECVLCLPENSFAVDALAKHVYSPQHLLNVLALHSKELHQRYCNSYDSDLLTNCLDKLIPQPAEQVKLMVVPSDKITEARDKILATIAEKQKSLDSKKRPLIEESPDVAGVSEPMKKKLKSDDVFEDISNSPKKNVLIVGDERSKKLYTQSPALQDMADIVSYPNSRLERILTGAITRFNSSYNVVVVIGMLHDFVNEFEKNGKLRLHMVNSELADVCNVIKRFTLRIRNLDSSARVFFTIPTYVDFIQYNKPKKMLSPEDFARLADFSSQIMDAFQRVGDEIRNVCKNTFCYDFNRALSSGIMDHQLKPSRALFYGTLENGFEMSAQAYTKLVNDMPARIQKCLSNVHPEKTYDPTFMECWADCENILVVGDSHIFKFDDTYTSDILTNVKVMSIKFSTISTILKAADSALTPETDVLLVVGLYREFAQNVIDGPNTLLEPVMPNKREIFDLLTKQKKKWLKMYPRLTVVFSIPQCVDFYQYNTVTNPDLIPTPIFATEMTNFTHQYSINIMSFYKELRPILTLGTHRLWLYHITNALFEHHSDLLPTLGNFNIKPQFPPNCTFDGFKPTLPTAMRMRADFMHFITSILRKHPVKRARFYSE